MKLQIRKSDENLWWVLDRDNELGYPFNKFEDAARWVDLIALGTSLFMSLPISQFRPCTPPYSVPSWLATQGWLETPGTKVRFHGKDFITGEPTVTGPNTTSVPLIPVDSTNPYFQ